MPAYDGRFFAPPAPVALVLVRNPATGAVVPDVPMLIDSGADVTLVPREAAVGVGARGGLEASYELVGFGGGAQVVPAARLELVLGRKTFRGLFLLVDEPTGILGRNLLNTLVVTLDGPGLEWRAGD